MHFKSCQCAMILPPRLEHRPLLLACKIRSVVYPADPHCSAECEQFTKVCVCVCLCVCVYYWTALPPIIITGGWKWVEGEESREVLL